MRVPPPPQVSGALIQRLSPTPGVPPHLVCVRFAPLSHVREGLHGTVMAPHLVVTVLANARPDETVRQAMTEIAATLTEQLNLGAHQVWIHWTDLPLAEPSRMVRCPEDHGPLPRGCPPCGTRNPAHVQDRGGVTE